MFPKQAIFFCFAAQKETVAVCYLELTGGSQHICTSWLQPSNSTCAHLLARLIYVKSVDREVVERGLYCPALASCRLQWTPKSLELRPLIRTIGHKKEENYPIQKFNISLNPVFWSVSTACPSLKRDQCELMGPSLKTLSCHWKQMSHKAL